MHIRRILVPLLGTENDRTGLDLGFHLAKDQCAHVDALFVRPDPEDAVPYLAFSDGRSEEIKEDYRQRAEVRGKRAAAKSRRQFNAACKKLGIAKSKRPSGSRAASAHWVEVVGRATRDVPEAGMLCDISIFAGPLMDYHRLLPNVLEYTLLESGRPLLFVPSGSIELPLERIAIAWDASSPAVRSVGAAAAFLQGAKNIQVLSVEEQHEDTPTPQKLVRYLAWHGLNAEGRVVPRDNEDVGQALLAEAQKVEADLLVMGGYAHNRFEEALFGGTTLHALRHTQIPLLLAH